MRVLFCTTGGLGHLLPLRPLASALRDRGHAVAWATAPDALPLLQGRDFELMAVGPTFAESRHAFRAAHGQAALLTGERLSAYTFPRLFGAILAPAMLQALDHAVQHWRPDCVVHEPAVLAAPLVCQQRGLPHLAHGYGLRPPAEYLRAAMVFFGPHWQLRGLVAPADGGLYRHLYLDIAPGSLQRPGEPADGTVFRFNPHGPGPVLWPALPAPLQTAWQGASLRGPRIYVSFGTVFNRSPALAVAAQAAAQAGGTVVVTVGADGDLSAAAALGSHVQVHRFVEQAALLRQCDAVVSHGGAGTLLGAAAHGVPQLVLPQAADHFRNARALVACGAGHSIAPERQTADQVAAALAGLLQDGAIARGAAALSREIAALPDVVAAAYHLERWTAGAG